MRREERGESLRKENERLPMLFAVVSHFLRRGDRIRTCDTLVPNQVRYRAALHPAAFLVGQCRFQNAGAKLLTFFENCKLLTNYFMISSSRNTFLSA